MPALPPVRIEPRLTVLVSPDDEQVDRSAPLGPGCLMVGRQPRGGGLAVADARMSRAHFEVRWCRDGSLRVRDLGSRHGTQVGGGHLDAPLHVRSDAVIRAGDTLFHLGFVIPPGAGADPTDGLIRTLASRLAGAGEGVFTVSAPPGTGLRRLAARTHRLRRTGGMLLLATGSVPEARPGDTVLAFPGVAPPPPAPGVLVISGGHAPTEASVLIPPLDTRRQEVWRVTRVLLERRLGDAPPIRPGAADRWLNAGFSDGWRTVAERIERLVTAWPGEVIGSRDVLRALGEEPADARSEPARRMDRPDREALARELARIGSVAGVARHYGRSRRQIYRWIERYGLTTG